MNNKLINSYNKNGFIIVKVFNKNEIDSLKYLIKQKVDQQLKNTKWDLADYHQYIDKENNSKITNNLTRYINVDDKIINIIENNQKISKILENKWRHSKFFMPDLNYLIGETRATTINNIRKNQIGFRIVVPKKTHYSISAPPHTDLHYAGKIRKSWRKNKSTNLFYTLWTPIIGFSKKYTLRVAPGSHLLNHPINKIDNQSKYISPVFEKKYYRKFKYKRFNLKKGEAILFDINLIHGGTENLGTKTRASLEFRLFNNKKINYIK